MPNFPWAPLYQQLRDQNKESSNESSSWLFVTVVGVTLAIELLETYLQYRNGRYLEQNSQLPEELKMVVSTIDKEIRRKKAEPEVEQPLDDDNDAEDIESQLSNIDRKFQRTREYHRDLHSDSHRHLWRITESVAFTLVGYCPFLWDVACVVGDRLAHWSEASSSIQISLIFVAMTDMLRLTRKALFNRFVHLRLELKYGKKPDPTRSKYGAVKETVFMLVGSVILTFTMLLGIQVYGNIFFLGPYIVWLSISLFPASKQRSDDSHPLEDGSLKDKIYKLAATVNYPLNEVLVVPPPGLARTKIALSIDGATSQVLLCEAMLSSLTDDEALALVGRELGRWKLGHVAVARVTAQALVASGFGLFWLCLGKRFLCDAFGFNDPKRPIPTVITLHVVFGILWPPMEKVLKVASNALFRHMALAEDRFVASLGMSSNLQMALCKIQLDNIDVTSMDRWTSAWKYRPSLAERLRLLMSQEEQWKIE